MALPLSESINALEGRTYTRNGEVLTVEKVQIEGLLVKIYTTAGLIEKHEDQMPGFIKSLRPSTETPIRTSPKPAPAPTATPPAALSPTANNSLQIMQRALLATLEKVQDGGANLDEARTVSKIVQTGINLARLELEAIKLSHKGQTV